MGPSKYLLFNYRVRIYISFLQIMNKNDVQESRLIEFSHKGKAALKIKVSYDGYLT